MPFYTYHCDDHGDEDILQGMNDVHEAICSICSKKMMRIFTPAFVKCGNAKMGNTRQELFDNLAQDGFANKDWKQHDSYYKSAVGIPTED